MYLPHDTKDVGGRPMTSRLAASIISEWLHYRQLASSIETLESLGSLNSSIIRCPIIYKGSSVSYSSSLNSQTDPIRVSTDKSGRSLSPSFNKETCAQQTLFPVCSFFSGNFKLEFFPNHNLQFREVVTEMRYEDAYLTFPYQILAGRSLESIIYVSFWEAG